MNIHLIACEMLRDELELAVTRTGIDYPTIWLDKGLHDTPEKLRAALQEKIDQLDRYDTIVLGMAYCGGALNGICSSHATLVVPRFDDCIRMILSREPGMRNAADPRSLYYTRQWMDSHGHITRELERYVARYGEKKARKVMGMMLANYRWYRMVDTGAYDLAEWEPKARQDAEALELEFTTVPGTTRVMEKLLRRDWDEEFILVPPGEPLKQTMFLDL